MKQPRPFQRSDKVDRRRIGFGEGASGAVISDGRGARPGTVFHEVKAHPAGRTAQEPGIDTGAAEGSDGAVAQSVVTDQPGKARGMAKAGEGHGHIAFCPARVKRKAVSLNHQLRSRRGQPKQQFAKAGDWPCHDLPHPIPFVSNGQELIAMLNATAPASRRRPPGPAR